MDTETPRLQCIRGVVVSSDERLHALYQARDRTADHTRKRGDLLDSDGDLGIGANDRRVVIDVVVTHEASSIVECSETI